MATIAKMEKGSRGFLIVRTSAADVVNAVNLATKSDGMSVYAALTLESGATVHVAGVDGRNPRRRTNRISKALKDAGSPVTKGAIVALKTPKRNAVSVRGMLAEDAAAAVIGAAS